MKQLFFILSLLLAVSVSPSFSQFEGEIVYNLEQFDADRSSVSEFTFTAASDRIYISSQRNLDVISGISSNGLLVRNDLQDFVFNTGKDEAIKVSKEDLDGLMNLLERFSGNAEKDQESDFDWENRLIETGNIRSHLGYEIEEYRLLGDNPDQFVSIWLTSDIKVLWGLMVEVWRRASSRFSNSELPIQLVMNSNSFPLLIEGVNNGSTEFRLESKSINKDDFDRSVIELSDDKRLVGLTELMMNMFRQQR